MMNIVNGGAHADNSVDLQEFMIVPVGARDASPRACGSRSEIYHTLKAVLEGARARDRRSATKAASRRTSSSSEARSRLIIEAAERAGYTWRARSRSRSIPR